MTIYLRFLNIFKKLKNSLGMFNSPRLHHLNMRIFKVKKSHKKAVDTLNSVFTAFTFSPKYALLFREGYRSGISDAFCVSEN